MQEEYKVELKKFYEIYYPLAKRHNLQMYSHFSIWEWEDDWIKIYKKTGRQQKLIIKVESKSDVACYRMAREQLCNWENVRKKEEQQAS